MLPAEGGDMSEKVIWDINPSGAQMLDGAIKVNRVPKDDRRRY